MDHLPSKGGKHVERCLRRYPLGTKGALNTKSSCTEKSSLKISCKVGFCDLRSTYYLLSICLI